MLVVDGSKATFMRIKPYRVCLHTPPSQWAWDMDLGNLPDLTLAQPTIVPYAKKNFYNYSNPESDAIWYYSSPFEGKP